MSKLSGIFSLRNWVAKQLTKPNAEGIMKLPNKGNIDFGEMMLREKLFTNGIDHKLIKDEKQLDELLNYIDASEKQKLKQGFNEHVGTNIDGSKNYFYTKKEKPSAEVIEVDFDKGRWKDTEPEKFFYGGFVEQPELGPTAHGSEALASRTRLAAPGSTSTTSTGLNYLLAEDNDNQRVPFGGGGFNAARRAFLKMMGAGAAGVGAAKSGLFGLLKGGAKKEVVKELTQVPIKNVEGMPAWFKPLVNKVIKEGDDVTKKFATKEREIVHTKKIDDVDEVTVYQDLDTGNVRVEYGPHATDDTGKFIRASNDEQVIQLEYRASEEIPLKHKKGSIKTKEEFSAVESEPEIINWDGDIEMTGINEVSKIDDLITDTSKLQKYATDKKLTIKELSESMKKQKYKNKLETDSTEAINYIEKKHGPFPDPSDSAGGKDATIEVFDKYYGKASGGLARMLGE